MESIQLPLGDVIEVMYLNGYHVTRFAAPDQIKATIGHLKPWDVGVDLIRLGSDGDGGYLVPDDLEGLAACFSPGVSDNSEFEAALARDFGVKSFLADYSVDGPAESNEAFDFEKKFLGSSTDETFMRLHDWVDRKAPETGDLLLQIDIEGAEYPVLIDTPPETLDRFRVIVIELHNIPSLLCEGVIGQTDVVLQKLTRNHTVVHLHPNNHAKAVKIGEIEVPEVIEATLIRNDRIRCRQPLTHLPHPLDHENHKGGRALKIQPIWYM